MALGTQKSIWRMKEGMDRRAMDGAPSLEGRGDRGATAAHRPQGWGAERGIWPDAHSLSLRGNQGPAGAQA